MAGHCPVEQNSLYVYSLCSNNNLNCFVLFFRSDDVFRSSLSNRTREVSPIVIIVILGNIVAMSWHHFSFI
ncbi:Uncharacterized protein APZ42_002269 [Daphnia magna]|uniref:Uncharacterized protein n=1 Tax=Daphnia magna TaxID=35525 RepID=A0A164IDW3_9CRUS|nr:Uncharacterized protein APZ42_002269 [Daphnia magna]